MPRYVLSTLKKNGIEPQFLAASGPLAPQMMDNLDVLVQTDCQAATAQTNDRPVCRPIPSHLPADIHCLDTKTGQSIIFTNYCKHLTHALPEHCQTSDRNTVRRKRILRRTHRYTGGPVRTECLSCSLKLLGAERRIVFRILPGDRGVRVIVRNPKLMEIHIQCKRGLEDTVSQQLQLHLMEIYDFLYFP